MNRIGKYLISKSRGTSLPLNYLPTPMVPSAKLYGIWLAFQSTFNANARSQKTKPVKNMKSFEPFIYNESE